MSDASKIIDGKKLAEELLAELSQTIADLAIDYKRSPALAVILVGSNPASQVYVRNKKLACAKVGIKSVEFLLPDLTTEAKLIELIANLNQDATIDGILVQLPLPSHINSQAIINTILPHKDVDGFHRCNIGALAVSAATLSPCTPQGIIYLLNSLPNFSYSGMHAVILGTSTIVGRPMALELLNRGVTVTVCNSKTRNIEQIIATADILVAAIGVPRFVAGNWLKPGVIVCDVGINRLKDGSLCGDVDFATAIDPAQYITPVPGGIGPLTIAMLVANTVHCFKLNPQKASGPLDRVMLNKNSRFLEEV